MTKENQNHPIHLLIDLHSSRNIFNHIRNGVFVTDHKSKILYVNPAFSEITHYKREEVIHGNPGMLHSGRHGKAFYKKMWDDITQHGFWEGEIWNRKKTGEIFPELLTITKIYPEVNNGDYYYVGIFSDITFLKKDISRKLHLAFHDPLTELPNRNYYMSHLHHLVYSAQHPENQMQPFSLLYMDLDKFKQVNDTYGHLVGDKLLRQVGRRVASRIRKGDIVARIGGDEFSFILNSITDKKSAEMFSDRLIKIIEEPFRIEGHLVSISASVGISLFSEDASSVEELIAKADKAMYKAKKNRTKVELSS